MFFFYFFIFYFSCISETLWIYVIRYGFLFVFVPCGSFEHCLFSYSHTKVAFLVERIVDSLWFSCFLVFTSLPENTLFCLHKIAVILESPLISGVKFCCFNIIIIIIITIIYVQSPLKVLINGQNYYCILVVWSSRVI
jgi:hypothetical protein